MSAMMSKSNSGSGLRAAALGGINRDNPLRDKAMGNDQLLHESSSQKKASLKEKALAQIDKKNKTSQREKAQSKSSPELVSGNGETLRARALDISSATCEVSATGRSDEDRGINLKPAAENSQTLTTSHAGAASAKVDPPIALAKEFLTEFEIAVVGDALYLHNGCFYEMLPDRKAQRLILDRFMHTQGISTMLSIIVKIVKLISPQNYDEFPVNSNIVVFKNGTLEIDTQKFRLNTPEDMANSALAINYDGFQRRMPHIEKFLRTITNGDDELRERVLQAVGYIVSNDISAKSFIYLQGVGDSGKSLFCSLISNFYPKKGANAVGRVALQDFGGRFALAGLVNARLNISEDLPDTILTPTAVSKVKMLSDFNRIECEQKYVPTFSFRFLCKLLFASNHPLRMKEYDQAFVNRIVYIPFKNAIPKESQDRHLLQKMLPELSALFNCALEAYRRLVNSGYDWAGNYEPEIIIPKSSTAPDKAFVVERFIRNCCTFDSTSTTSTEELKSAYIQFCNENGHQAIAGDRFSREFSAVLPETVERVKIGNQRRGYRGVKLK